jgi:predicted SnoaL-like aldol condensation-catalyzing enzyme
MSQSTQSKNKALVLEAFDTLFNKRDYAAAERFWSPNYIQHSAHIERAAKVSSTSSRLLRRRSDTSRA